MDKDGNIIISKDVNNEANGRFHSDWIKMLYPRMKIARNLLSEEGIVFISIDDRESDNLRLVIRDHVHNRHRRDVL